MHFTSDHNGFYLNSVPFYPRIQEGNTPLSEGSNVVLITLPAHLDHDLNWSDEKLLAETMIASGKYVFWEMDLGLSNPSVSIEDSATFFSFSLAVEEFSKQIWPSFGDKTFGVALYRGAFPHPKFSEKTEEDLLAAIGFSEYLHRLISFLPETVLPFALLDISSISSLARSAQLLSKARFEYLNLAVKGAQVPFSGICWEKGHEGQGFLGTLPQMQQLNPAPMVGVYLPQDELIDLNVTEQLDALIMHLKQTHSNFRIVAEEKLTELWDGLDTLIVPSIALSTQGKRKLLGFIAAGGEITTLGKPIGLPEEAFITF